MDIDTIIAEGMPAPEANAQPQADAKKEIETNIETPEVEAPDKGEEDDGKEVWSKKAVNAMSRRDKQIGKLRAEREALAAEVNRLKVQDAQKVAPSMPQGRPKESDYDNFADFLTADNKWNIEQQFAERDKQQKDTEQSLQEKAWVAERETFVATKAQELAKDIPELINMADEYADVIDEWNPQLQKLFLEADNAPLAFYNLVKEGKLEALSSMSLAKAAMEIGRAQTQAAPKSTPTRAPAPMTPSKGTAATGKSLDRMTGDELLKWVNS